MLLTGAAALGTSAVTHGSAEAAFTFTFLEQGGNIVAAGSGSLDLAGLPPQTPIKQNLPDTGVWAQIGVVGLAGTVLVYTGITGPGDFGSGVRVSASSGSGNTIAVNGSQGLLAVPSTYVSGDALSSSMAFAGKSFVSIGLVPGTYTWTWGSASKADSFTLQIGPAAVPEPASLTVLAVGLAGLGMVLCTRRA
jgi:hypothetical protein